MLLDRGEARAYELSGTDAAFAQDVAVTPGGNQRSASYSGVPANPGTPIDDRRPLLEELGHGFTVEVQMAELIGSDCGEDQAEPIVIKSIAQHLVVTNTDDFSQQQHEQLNA